MIFPLMHIVSDQYPLKAGETIEPGMAVAINSDGLAVKADANDSEPSINNVIGLCADKNRASEAYEFVNRLSDSGNDTAASGMVTVYHSGGVFRIDVDDSRITTPLGTAISGVIEANATCTPGTYLYLSVNAGKLTHTQTSTLPAIAQIITAKGTVDSGIPGEYEPGSSVAYANYAEPRQWVTVKLCI